MKQYHMREARISVNAQKGRVGKLKCPAETIEHRNQRASDVLGFKDEQSPSIQPPTHMLESQNKTSISSVSVIFW